MNSRVAFSVSEIYIFIFPEVTLRGKRTNNSPPRTIGTGNELNGKNGLLTIVKNEPVKQRRFCRPLLFKVDIQGLDQPDGRHLPVRSSRSIQMHRPFRSKRS